MAFRPDYGTLSTNAGRRTILVQFNPPPGRLPLVCAEPPPDAVEAYANAVSVAARAAAEAPAAGQSGASLGAQFARNLGTSIAPVLYRSQGLQMIRDFQFTLCVMRMNGVISDETYITTLRQMIPEAVKLVQAEMPAILKAAERPVPNVNAPTINLPAVTVFDAAKASGS